MMNPIKDFLNRINGFSTPVGGISWNPKFDEEKEIYNLLQKLSNRRLLEYGHGLVNRNAAIKSTELMRLDITNTLTNLPIDSSVKANLENVRAILKNFQTYVEHQSIIDKKGNIRMTNDFVIALNNVRDLINGNISSFIQGNENLKELPQDFNGQIDIIRID